MKKVFIGLAVVLVLIIGGGYLVYSNLDKIVETAIETAGTRVLDTGVAVDSVSLDLMGGTASIYGFSIANPRGFSDGAMASFEELSVAIDVQNLSAENIHILSIVARSPQVFYENRGGNNNFDTVTSRLSSGEETAPAEDSGAQPNLQVDSVRIEDIGGTLQDDRLPSPMEVNLGDVILSDLNGTPREIARQIMRPLLTQIGNSAGRQLLQSVEGLQERADELEQEARRRRDELEQQADDIRNQADDIRNQAEGLLDGFRRN